MMLATLTALLLCGGVHAAESPWALVHRKKAPNDDFYYTYHDFQEVDGVLFALPGLSASNDGGKTWSERESLAENCFKAGCNTVFATKNIGFNVTGETALVFISTNGGRNWDDDNPAELPGDDYMPSLAFFDAKNGFGLCDGDFIATKDGGRSWANFPLSSFDRNNLGGDNQRAVVVRGDRAWLAFGLPASLLLTADRGLTWTTVSLPDENRPKALCFVDDQHGWLLTHGSNKGDSALLTTADGGKNWNRTALDSERALKLNDLACRDAQTLWASGNGLVLASADGGTTWSELPAPQAEKGFEWDSSGIYYQRSMNDEALLYAADEWRDLKSPDDPKAAERLGAIYRLKLPYPAPSAR